MKYSLLCLSLLVFITSFAHAEDKQRYRAVVVFSSVCCGTSADDNDAIDRYVRDYQAQKSLSLKMDQASYGDEGDINYCYSLSELNEHQQILFIAGLQKTLSDQKQASERTSNSGVSWVAENDHCLGI